jgi:hypothetical protein
MPIGQQVAKKVNPQQETRQRAPGVFLPLGADNSAGSTLSNLRFNLLEELAGKKKDNADGEDFEEIGSLTLCDSPSWIIDEIRYQIGDLRYSEEKAVSLCLAKALARCHARDNTKHWIALRHAAISTEQDYSHDQHSKDGFNEICEFCNAFPFTIDPNHTRTPRRTIRCPAATIKDTSELAKLVGMKLSTLAQVLIIDGLRGQPKIVNREVMDTIVDTFYRRQRRRILTLIGTLESLEIALCNSVTDEIACVRSGGPHESKK